MKYLKIIKTLFGVLVVLSVLYSTTYGQSKGSSLQRNLSSYGLQSPSVVILDNSIKISYYQDEAEFSSVEEEANRIANISKIVSDQNKNISLIVVRQIFDDGQIIEFDVKPLDAYKFLNGSANVDNFFNKIIIRPLTRGLFIVPGKCIPKSGDNCNSNQACSCYPNEECDPGSNNADYRGCVNVHVPSNSVMMGEEYICKDGYEWNNKLTDCIASNGHIVGPPHKKQTSIISPSADAYVYAYNYRNWDRSNRGKYDQLRAGWHPIGGESRAYIKFDLSNVDPSKVTKAVLKLYHFQTAGNDNVDLGIYRVTGPWKEGTDTYHSGHDEKTAAPGELSWVQQPPIDSYLVTSFNPGHGFGDWIEVDITPLVKQWLSGTPNYGLVIKPIGHLGRNIGASVYHFASRERKAGLDQPKGEDKAPTLLIGNYSTGVSHKGSTHQPNGSAPDISGTWKWFDGETIHIYPNGTAAGGFKGKWQANWNGSGFTYTINWNNGQYIDSLILHGNTLDGHNQNGTHVWGKRILPGNNNYTKENVWVLNADNNIYKWNGKSWDAYPGKAQDIGVGANGSVWIMDTVNHRYGGSIYRLEGSNFVKTTGQGIRIDVDPNGNPWAINNLSNIYKWKNNAWHRMPGRATDIGIGANGDVWVIGTDVINSNHGIYKWNGTQWVKYPGAAVRIDVGPNGAPWVVNAAGDIYKFTNNSWHQLPGKAKDISVGVDGTPWIIGTDNTLGGHGIYRWNGSNWARIPGGATAISVGGLTIGTNSKPIFNKYANAVAKPCASDKEFIRSLYQSILDRNPKVDISLEPGHGAAHLRDLQNGIPRWRIIWNFFNSPEYRNKQKNHHDFIRDVYQAVLGREPQEKEIGYWPQVDRNDILRKFFNSDGYLKIKRNCKNRAQTFNSGIYRVEQGRNKSIWRLHVSNGRISGTSEWSCCPGHRIDTMKGTISGNKVVIERDCSGQGWSGACRQTYRGTIKSDRIAGFCSGTGLTAGDTWVLYLDTKL